MLMPGTEAPLVTGRLMTPSGEARLREVGEREGVKAELAETVLGRSDAGRKRVLLCRSSTDAAGPTSKEGSSEGE